MKRPNNCQGSLGLKSPRGQGPALRPRPSVEAKARTLTAKAIPLEAKATKLVRENPQGQCLASMTISLAH
jgi:hypothetical protein